LDDKVVKLTLRSDISGEHTLVVEGVKDQYKNEMAKQSILFDVEDQTDPDFAKFKASLHGADKDVQTLIINFDDVMATDGVYSVLDLEKYRVEMEKYVDKKWNGKFDYVELADIEDDIDISISDDGKKVEIELDTEDAGYKFAEDKWIQIARVADAAGNKTVALSGQVKIGGVGKVSVDKFEAVAKDELKLILKSALADFAEEDYVLFVKKGDDTEITSVLGDIAVDEERNSDGNTVIIFRLLDEELDADATFTWADGNSPIFVRLNGTEDYEIVSKDAYGAKVEFAETTFEDKIKPELIKDGITAAGNVITLRFDEAVATERDALAATDFIVEADGDVLDAGIHYTVSVDGSTEIEITLAGKYETFDGVVTISTAKDVKYIKDVKDGEIGNNVLAEIDAEDIEIATAPTVSDIVYGANSSYIEITFNEEMDLASVEDKDSYVVTGASIDSITTDGDVKVVTIRLNEDAENGDTIIITDSVTDYSGTELAAVRYTFDGTNWGNETPMYWVDDEWTDQEPTSED
jgi:DNA-binding protein YbaB